MATNTVKTTLKTEWLESGILREQKPFSSHSVETTSDLKRENTQIVGTTHELIEVGDITDDAYCRIENIHATAIVSVGHDHSAAFVGIGDIRPGDPPLILPVVSTLATTYLKSDTASTPVRVTLIKLIPPV